MANPYGMVMGLDGRWEYDPRAFTNAQFRAAPSRFPFMGVGSLGAGLMTQSPLAGLGSEIPGIRGPGGAPASGAQHGASPLYSPSYSTSAISGVGPELDANTRALIDFDMEQNRQTMGLPPAPWSSSSVDPNTVTASVTPGSDLTSSVPWGTGIGFSNIPSQEELEARALDATRGLGRAGLAPEGPEGKMGGAVLGTAGTDPLGTSFTGTYGPSNLGYGLDTGFASPEESIADIISHMAGVGVYGKNVMDTREAIGLGKSARDVMDFSTHKAAEEVMSWASQNDIDPGVAAAMAVGKAVAGRTVDPSAPVGSVFSPEVLSHSFKTEFDVDIEDVPTVSLSFTKDLTPTQEKDRYMEQAITVPSPLANPDITVANTIAEQIAETTALMDAMGLTGATAAAAEQAMTSSSGYVTVDQIAGLVAAQQEQEQVAAEQAAAAQAQAVANAQAAAAAVYSASQASDDDVESEVDTFSSIGTSKAKGKAKGKSKGKAKGKSKGKSRMDRIDAALAAVGPGESALSEAYGKLGYGGGLGEGAGGGLGEGMGGFGGGWT